MPQTFATGKYLYLTAKLSPGGSSFVGDRDLGITKGRLKMRDPNNPDSTYTEWIEFGSVTAVGDGTFTYGSLVRQLSQVADPATSLGTGNTWVAGTEAKLVAMHDQLADRLNGSLVPVYATTVARDAAITAPTNGMSAYVTADGVFYDYQGGVWATRGNSATQNASATVAGKVEIATSAESISGTNTGGTGALLSVLPSDIAANEQSGSFVYASSVDVSDTYTASLTPALTAYTTGQRVRVKFTTANIGACTLNLNSLGAKSIKMRDGTDPLDNAIIASDIAELVYDGTNFVLQSAPRKASLSEFQAGTDDQKYVTSLRAGYAVRALDSTSTVTTVATAPTERSTGTGSFVKLKEITANYTGTYRITFDLCNQDAGNTAQGRIYKNGSAFGTNRSNTNGYPTYSTYTEDLAFTSGDLIQLYANGPVGHSAYVRYMKCDLNIVPNAFAGTINTD